MPTPTLAATPASALDDAGLVALVGGGDHAAFELLMRRHNGRLFRVARATLGDDAEAEDALQDAYLDAYRHIPEFRGDAAVGTWLTRIVINRALMRLRSRRRRAAVIPIDRPRSPAAEDSKVDMADTRAESPPDAAHRAEVRRLLERKIDDLPVVYRTVFILREVEEMSVQETADALSIPSATVRTRLFRARALLRESIAQDLDVTTAEVFAFAGARCDRIVAGVLARLAAPDSAPA